MIVTGGEFDGLIFKLVKENLVRKWTKKVQHHQFG
jgi:hypothetical protein